MNKTFIYLEKIEEKIKKDNSLKEKLKIIIEKIFCNLQTYELQETLLILNEKNSKVLNPLISIYMEVNEIKSSTNINVFTDKKDKKNNEKIKFWDFLSELSKYTDNKDLKLEIDNFILYLILVKSYVKSNLIE